MACWRKGMVMKPQKWHRGQLKSVESSAGGRINSWRKSRRTFCCRRAKSARALSIDLKNTIAPFQASCSWGVSSTSGRERDFFVLLNCNAQSYCIRERFDCNTQSYCIRERLVSLSFAWIINKSDIFFLLLSLSWMFCFRSKRMILVDLSLYKRKWQVELVPPGKVNFCQVSGIDLIQGQLGNLIKHCQRCNVNLQCL